MRWRELLLCFFITVGFRLSGSMQEIFKDIYRDENASLVPNCI